MRTFIKYLFRFYYKIFYKVRVHYKERIPEGTFLICPNHFNASDPFAIGSQFDVEIDIMAKKELFKNKIVGWFIKLNGGFPVDRDGNDFAALKKSIQILKDDHHLMIFPEGTRNDSNKPLEAKPGVAMIAIKSKVPILPVAFKTTYKLFSRMDIYILEPVYFDKYYDRRVTTEEMKTLSQDIVNNIYEVLNDSENS